MDSVQVMKRATELAEAHYTQKEILQWLTRDRIEDWIEAYHKFVVPQ